MPNKPKLFISQVLIITPKVLEEANKELMQDDPGNPGQTLEEYVNMRAETLGDEINGAIVNRIDILSTSVDLIAIIHYSI